jgi:hypothetical protein
VTIWVVRIENEIFVCSVRGADGFWYRGAEHHQEWQWYGPGRGSFMSEASGN